MGNPAETQPNFTALFDQARSTQFAQPPGAPGGPQLGVPNAAAQGLAVNTHPGLPPPGMQGGIPGGAPQQPRGAPDLSSIVANLSQTNQPNELLQHISMILEQKFTEFRRDHEEKEVKRQKIRSLEVTPPSKMSPEQREEYHIRRKIVYSSVISSDIFQPLWRANTENDDTQPFQEAVRIAKDFIPKFALQLSQREDLGWSAKFIEQIINSIVSEKRRYVRLGGARGKRNRKEQRRRDMEEAELNATKAQKCLEVYFKMPYNRIHVAGLRDVMARKFQMPGHMLEGKTKVELAVQFAQELIQQGAIEAKPETPYQLVGEQGTLPPAPMKRKRPGMDDDDEGEMEEDPTQRLQIDPGMALRGDQLPPGASPFTNSFLPFGVGLRGTAGYPNPGPIVPNWPFPPGLLNEMPQGKDAGAVATAQAGMQGLQGLEGLDKQNAHGQLPEGAVPGLTVGAHTDFSQQPPTAQPTAVHPDGAPAPNPAQDAEGGAAPNATVVVPPSVPGQGPGAAYGATAAATFSPQLLQGMPPGMMAPTAPFQLQQPPPQAEQQPPPQPPTPTEVEVEQQATQEAPQEHQPEQQQPVDEATHPQGAVGAPPGPEEQQHQAPSSAVLEQQQEQPEVQVPPQLPAAQVEEPVVAEQQQVPQTADDSAGCKEGQQIPQN